MTDGQPTAMRRRLDKNELVLCVCFNQARTADFPMMVAACGYDAIYIDLEHTATSLETTSMLCATAIACGLTPFVRVPSQDHQYMTRALDTGAMGIIVPHINTKVEVERLVQICKFPPVGHRSIIGPNPVTRYKRMSTIEMTEYLNQQTILCAMIESPEAVDHVDEIAGVPGLEMILIGPYDLTAEMGILGQFQDSSFLKAIELVAEACRKHDKILGIAGIRDMELLNKCVSMGLRFISAGTDDGMFIESASARANQLRSINVR